jgi:hypothetical protein
MPGQQKKRRPTWPPPGSADATYVVAAPFFFLSAVFGFLAPLLLPGPLSPIGRPSCWFELDPQDAKRARQPETPRGSQFGLGFGHVAALAGSGVHVDAHAQMGRGVDEDFLGRLKTWFEWGILTTTRARR